MSRPSFSQIAAISLTDRVTAVLKDAFFSGKLKPGDAIVERHLAREMKVGTPVVREALIALQGQGFVRRVTNTGTFVTSFTAEEVRQLYMLRIELESIAFRWAKERVSKGDVEELRALVDDLVEAGEKGNRRDFLERDFRFHRRCWVLSDNAYLVETLERLMAPLFAFAVLATGVPITAGMAHEHRGLVDALASMEEPEFTEVVRGILSGFAARWISAVSAADRAARPPGESAAGGR